MGNRYRTIIKNVGSAIRNSADVPLRKAPRCYQVALEIAEMAANAAAILFAIATGLKVLNEIIKGKK